MVTLSILLALLLTALPGSLALNLLIPTGVSGRRALILGNGLLLGLLCIPLLMRLLDLLGQPITFNATASLTVALAFIAGWASILQRKKSAHHRASTSGLSRLAGGEKPLFMLFLLLIIIRVTTLGLELLGRPLFPWDATMHWATKARVWFEYKSMVPFVDSTSWLKLSGFGVFTDNHPDYPSTIPLLQVWMTSAAGYWDESLMNLPWILCLMALGAAFYGQARAAGVAPMVAIAFTYMLISMPLINTHVALAGYADIFLGTCYCAAIMAFHNWAVTRLAWQGFLAAAFALACTLIKNEGFYWLLTFIPALLVVVLARRKAVLMLVVLLISLLAILLLFPRELVVAGHSLRQLNLRFHPQTLAAIAGSLWAHDNWHLFGGLLVVMLPLGFIRAGAAAKHYLGITVALACALGLFIFLFTFTGYAPGAVRFTAVGRIFLQLVPAGMYLLMLLSNEVFLRANAGNYRGVQTGATG